MFAVKSDGLFKIGEMAGMFHVSISTLRHYEKIGILIPEYVDPETGYRYYSTRQFEVLYTIKYLRNVGLTLAEIASFVNNRSLDEIKLLLQQQIEQVRKKIVELEAVEKQIKNRLWQIAHADSAITGVIKLEHMPARKLLILNKEIVPENPGEIELAISELYGKTVSPEVFLGKIGVGVHEEHIKRGVFRPCDFLFMVVEENEKQINDCVILPEMTCAVTCFSGGHEEAEEPYKKLLAHLAENEYEITGPALEMTIIDYGFTNDISKFLTEIQIPIRKAD